MLLSLLTDRRGEANSKGLKLATFVASTSASKWYFGKYGGRLHPSVQMQLAWARRPNRPSGAESGPGAPPRNSVTSDLFGDGIWAIRAAWRMSVQVESKWILGVESWMPLGEEVVGNKPRFAGYTILRNRKSSLISSTLTTPEPGDRFRLGQRASYRICPLLEEVSHATRQTVSFPVVLVV
jgi:hypothetical protein